METPETVATARALYVANLRTQRRQLAKQRDALARMLAVDSPWNTVTPGQVKFVEDRIALIDAALSGKTPC